MNKLYGAIQNDKRSIVTKAADKHITAWVQTRAERLEVMLDESGAYTVKRYPLNSELEPSVYATSEVIARGRIDTA